MVRAYEILFEFDLKSVLEKYKDRLQKKLDFDKINKSAEEVIKAFMTYDPSPNKAYVLWMLNRFMRDKIKLEDMYKVKEDLALFMNPKVKNKLKQAGQKVDINQVEDEKELSDIIEPFKQNDSDFRSDTEIEKDFYKTGEAELIYNDSDYKIVVPRSEKASCYFGRNTRWCTAATEADENGNSLNAFESYNRQGPLYIILHKQTNARWQFQFETDQLMNEKDQPINLIDFRNTHPKVVEIFNEKGLLTSVYKVRFNIDVTQDDVETAIFDVYSVGDIINDILTHNLPLSKKAISNIAKSHDFIDNYKGYLQTLLMNIKNQYRVIPGDILKVMYRETHGAVIYDILKFYKDNKIKNDRELLLYAVYNDVNNLVRALNKLEIRPSMEISDAIEKMINS